MSGRKHEDTGRLDAVVKGGWLIEWLERSGRWMIETEDSTYFGETLREVIDHAIADEVSL